MMVSALELAVWWRGCLWALSIYCVVSIVRSWWKRRRRIAIWKQIPSCPEETWLLGQGLALARTATPWHTLNNWLSQSKGSIARFHILGHLSVILDDPTAIKKIFQTHYKAYIKDLAFSYGTFLSILGTGLVTSEGSLWQKQRLLMAPALRVDLLEVVLPITQRALKPLSMKLDHCRQTSQPIEIADEVRHLTLQVIGEAIMSLSHEECDALAKLYLPTMEECNRRVIHRWRMYLPTASWFRQERRLSRLDSFIKNVIRRRWQDYQPTKQPRDLLDQMLASAKKTQNELNSVNIEQMCCELKTFLLAGHETSASMLAWSLYELLQNPDCFAKVRAEARRLFASSEPIPRRKNVDEMTYTLAVLKETLRKYSIVPDVARELTLECDDLCGYSIPQGTMIIVSIRGVHAMYKDPEAFRPERFLPGGEYDCFDDDIRPFMFLPFIQGPRNCLGQYFALLESRYVLAYLINHYEFELAEKEIITPGDVIPEAPVNGVRLLVR